MAKTLAQFKKLSASEQRLLVAQLYLKMVKELAEKNKLPVNIVITKMLKRPSALRCGKMAKLQLYGKPLNQLFEGTEFYHMVNQAYKTLSDSVQIQEDQASVDLSSFIE